MKTVKYLLIGGGLASHSAAARIRQLDSSGSILIVGAEKHRPYDRPPLSKYYMQGQQKIEEVFLKDEPFYRQQNIELMLGAPVERLDAAGKTAAMADGQVIQFGKALLATGGRPVRLNLPGTGLAGVHYLRTIDDAMAISDEAAEGKKAVIIGGGFIGLELAASLTQRGAKVTLLERREHIWRHFADARLAGFFQDSCARHGVTILTNEQALEIRGAGKVSSVLTASARLLPCDFVCIAVGIVPNVELAVAAGLKVDDGVAVNASGQTSCADIYAAGDIMNFLDPHAGVRRRVEHWGNAEYSGGLAGANMAGAAERYALLNYIWSDIFDLHLEFAGDERGYEKMLMRGRMEDRSFAIFYLRDGLLKAYFAVNYKKKQYVPLQKLIEKRVSLADKEAQLQDPAFDVATLAPKG